jgi:fructose-1,6-bisphosphatase II / sedoheptulose-1,7-bisphosphatase
MGTNGKETAMPVSHSIGRNLAMAAVRVTEAAALSASRFLGRGDEVAADIGARDAMHRALSGLDINGAIRIGEDSSEHGERLCAGEKAGTGNGPSVDVGLLPLEGPTIIAKGEPNGISVIAMAESGGILSVPKLYMEKIAVGGGMPKDLVSLEATPEENLVALAKTKRVEVADLVVCILDRPRHAELIGQIRAAGARIMLIADGDVSGVIATTQPSSGVDIYMGIGGAREGVLAAAALACAGGRMHGRLVLRSESDRALAISSGIKDLTHIYDVNDMASGDVTFAATGVTPGAMLRGVVRVHGCPITHSMVMRSTTGTMRYIEAHHDFSREAAPLPLA